MQHIEDKIQAVADLREPIREDQSFYEGANMADLIIAAMNGEDIKPALDELSQRFIEKHQDKPQQAISMGHDIAKELHHG